MAPTTTLTNPPAPVSPTPVIEQESPPTLPLAEEVIFNILKHLNAPELLTCGLVCSHLRAITQDNLLWKDLFNRRFPNRNAWEIKDFQEAYKNCYLLHSNLARGIYASHTLKEHTVLVTSLAAFDGKLFSSSWDRTIKVLNLETGACLSTFTEHTTWVKSFVIANGKLFSGSSDNTIKVRDLETGVCLDPLPAQADGVYSLVVADGKLVSGSKDTTIRVWDLEKGACLHTLTGHTDTVDSLAVADGKLFSGSKDTTIRVWDLETGECLNALTGHTTWVKSLVIANGKLFSGSMDGIIKIWDLKTGACLNTLTGHKRWVTSFVVFDGKLFSSSYDKTIRVWDLETGAYLNALTEHEGEITCLATFDGKLFSGSFDHTIRMWDFKAKHAEVFKEIADLFRSDDPKVIEQAMTRFSRMPQSAKDQVYAELYDILKPFTNDYPGCAEYAFHDQHAQSSTPEQKVQAIENYAARTRAAEAKDLQGNSAES